MTVSTVTDAQDREAMRLAAPVINEIASRLAQVSSLEDEKGQLLAVLRLCEPVLDAAFQQAQVGSDLEKQLSTALDAVQEWVTVDETPAPARVA